MINHATTNGIWGVSHNENNVLLKVSSFSNIDRVRLSIEEVDELIKELEYHKRELLAGTWYGSKMKSNDTRNEKTKFKQ